MPGPSVSAGRAVALAQRRHDPERRHQRAAAQVRDLTRRLHRLAAAELRPSAPAGRSAPGSSCRGPTRRVWGRLAVARDRAVHDPRVPLAHALVAHAQALEHARAEGLQHHVRVAHQRQQRLAAALALQVQADRALVAVQRQEQRRLRAVVPGAPRKTEATSGCSRPCPCPPPSARPRRSPPAAASRSRPAAGARGRARGRPPGEAHRRTSTRTHPAAVGRL